MDASLLHRTKKPYEASFDDMISKFIDRFERLTGLPSTVKYFSWIVVPEAPDYFLQLKGNLLLMRFVCGRVLLEYLNIKRYNLVI